MKHFARLLCMLTLLVTLSACSAVPAPDPTATPAPTPAETPALTMKPESTLAPGTELGYAADELYITVTLPAGWAGRFDDSDEGFPCARVWMEESPEEAVRFWCAQQPVGLCGTGVTFGQIALDDGRALTTAQEDIDGSRWFCWILDDGERQFCADGSLPPERFEEMREGLAALLQSASAQPDD
ncbi:MAG: hypothetical protein ACI4XW_13060 [Candidatus Spyradocola sp.]